jgi:hypothetical protein
VIHVKRLNGAWYAAHSTGAHYIALWLKFRTADDALRVAWGTWGGPALIFTGRP